MRVFESTVPIARPPAEVWAFYNDLANLPHLVPQVAWATEIGAVGAVGAREYTIAFRNGRQTTHPVEFVAYDPPRCTDSRWSQGSIAFRAQLRYEDAGDGTTLLHQRIEAAPEGIVARVQIALLWAGMTRAWTQLLGRLKLCLETRAPSVRAVACGHCGAPMLIGHAGVATCTYCGRPSSGSG